LPVQGMRCGDEGVGGNDDLVAHPGCPDRDLERDRAVAHGEAVPHAHALGDALLELPNDWTVVRQPTAVEDVTDTFQEALTAADVRASNVQRSLEGRGVQRHGGSIVRPALNDS